MSDLSRRALVTAAAALPVLSIPAIAIATPEPDPVFASIEAHRMAYREVNEQELDEEIDRLADVEGEVMVELLSVVPSSLAGAAALSRYAAELESRDYRCLMDHPGYYRQSVQWSYFIHRNVADSIIECVRRGLTDGNIPQRGRRA